MHLFAPQMLYNSASYIVCDVSVFLPNNFSLLIRRGQMEKSSIACDVPAAKAAYRFLQDNVSSSFSFPGWNKGRIVCERSQLKRILSGTESSSNASKEDGTDSSSDGSKEDYVITLSNSPIPSTGVKSSPGDDMISETKMRTSTELMAGIV